MQATSRFAATAVALATLVSMTAPSWAAPVLGAANALGTR
jgi:hypothetical protein